MKEPCSNAACFKSAELEVPQGLGAVTEGPSLHPCVRNQFYFRRVERAGDGYLELLEGHQVVGQDFAFAQSVNGSASQSGAPDIRELQNRAVKRYIPEHRSSL